MLERLDSASYELCDLRQVPYPLCTSVFSGALKIVSVLQEEAWEALSAGPSSELAGII